ncbi:MAG: hypothetical protein IJ202_13785 [Bacteroidales bacterium]|nr:hypothetical protein [Bacteroidales bacterium]
MKITDLRRKFEKTLYEGMGKQLMWLVALILIVLALFWGIVSFVFKDGLISWQDLLSLFLDPGSFGGTQSHDIFRLISVLLGMLLFSALLISMVTNIFENVADSVRSGRAVYSHKGHVLIFGSGNMLFSMLNALLAEDSPYPDEDIVVVTSSDVESLRKSIFSLPFIDSEKEKSLRRRLSVYFGERDNTLVLEKKNNSKNAKVIYILGEDEENGDAVSIRCCRKLKSICSGVGFPVMCYLVLKDPLSMEVYKYVVDSETAAESDLQVDVVDAYSYVAEQVLVGENEGKSGEKYPCIDYREIVTGESGFEVIGGIRAEDDKVVHLVIAGMGNMARAMALTAAHNCHFPNFDGGKRRTVISFVDEDMKGKMDKFLSTYADLFRLSHYAYVSFDEEGLPVRKEFSPDGAYGDFLDVEWEFIDSSFIAPSVGKVIDGLVNDSRRSLSVVISTDDQNENIDMALHLPDSVYRKGIPVFVYQPSYADVLKIAKLTSHFGNLHLFGMSSDVQDDPLFLSRATRGQRVNFIYNQAYGEVKYKDEVTAWFTIPEAHKMSSIYSANGMKFKQRSFSLDSESALEAMTEKDRESIYEVEHRRWMMSVILLGYAPVEEEKRKAWKQRRLSESTAKDAKAEYKKLKKNFIHLDIEPYDELIPSEKEKDKIIIDQLFYILYGKPRRV